MTTAPITAPHPQYAALLATVLANPEDDWPRLVMADWLEEFQPEGQASADRAAFIRLQIELAHTPMPCFNPILHEQGCAACAIRRRERDLLKEHAAAWLSPSPLGFGVVNQGAGQTGWALTAEPVRLGERYAPVTFRRGFAERLICPWQAWSAHADAVLRLHPVREVTLTTAPTAGRMQHNGEEVPVLEYLLPQVVGGTTRYCLRAQKSGILKNAAFTVADLLAAEWPKVTFTLPPHVAFAVPPSTSPEQLDAARRFIATMGGAFRDAANGMAPVMLEALNEMRRRGLPPFAVDPAPGAVDGVVRTD